MQFHKKGRVFVCIRAYKNHFKKHAFRNSIIKGNIWKFDNYFKIKSLSEFSEGIARIKEKEYYFLRIWTSKYVGNL